RGDPAVAGQRAGAAPPRAAGTAASAAPSGPAASTALRPLAASTGDPASERRRLGGVARARHGPHQLVDAGDPRVVLDLDAARVEPDGHRAHPGATAHLRLELRDARGARQDLGTQNSLGAPLITARHL